MSRRNAHTTRTRAPELAYRSFEKINGQHSLQAAVPEACVLYPVRALKRGQVAYFNFHLAKEMGLIDEQHPHEMNPELAKMILDTFAIQIINEYDQIHHKYKLKSDVKPHAYMATRYLQLQHADKTGRTSGDGRSVWNGMLQHKGTTWDISSRGTGVTCLAPGAVEANRPLKTGAGEFGYGCGLADVDELLGSALMSEIFFLQGISTERVLTVIDLGKGVGIGVRAAPNLIRPAHLFLWLKQEKREPLRRATDFFIERQQANKAGPLWTFDSKSADRYKKMLRAVADDFARFAAALERNYIFAWLDWDGDNVLASAGIIDYGSVRQFGLRHDQYRYDDVQRFSTNLNEQKGKARLTVQVFAQLVDFLNTGKRKSIDSFAHHPALKQFDDTFERELLDVFLKQIGFESEQRAQLMLKHTKIASRLFEAFSLLEKTKTKDKLKRVPDGINRPAVFRMRALLRELPAIILTHGWPENGKLPLTPEECLQHLASSFARKRDLELTGQLKTRLLEFQRTYLDALKAVFGGKTNTAAFENFVQRAAQENMSGRITGNSSEFLIDEILSARRKGLSIDDLNRVLDLFISHQAPAAIRRRGNPRPLDLTSAAGALFQQLIQITHEYEDEI